MKAKEDFEKASSLCDKKRIEIENLKIEVQEKTDKVTDMKDRFKVMQIDFDLGLIGAEEIAKFEQKCITEESKLRELSSTLETKQGAYDRLISQYENAIYEKKVEEFREEIKVLQTELDDLNKLDNVIQFIKEKIVKVNELAFDLRNKYVKWHGYQGAADKLKEVSDWREYPNSKQNYVTSIDLHKIQAYLLKMQTIINETIERLDDGTEL